MTDILAGALKKVPISMFNRGYAGQVFREVQRNGMMVATKKNKTECVLLSPGMYIQLMNEVNDAHLAMEAFQRIESYNPATSISAETVNEELGIKEEELADSNMIEFE